jgi:hypothetical protein
MFKKDDSFFKKSFVLEKNDTTTSPSTTYSLIKMGPRFVFSSCFSKNDQKNRALSKFVQRKAGKAL